MTWPFRMVSLKIWLAGWAGLTLVTTLVGLLIVNVLDDGPLGRFDRSISFWFADHRTPRWNSLSQIGAGLADAYTLTPAVIILVFVLAAVFRRWHESLVLAAGILLEKAVFLPSTYLVDRPRPPVTQLDGNPPTSSYPSGHVAAAVVFYVVCAIVICWHVRYTFVRVLVWAIAVVVPIAVAISRMILGMHFFSDVIVGAVLGAVSVAIGMRLARRTLCDLDARSGVESRRRLDRGTEPEQATAERDRAEREPRRPEAQPRDGVAGPVHAQQHP